MPGDNGFGIRTVGAPRAPQRGFRARLFRAASVAALVALCAGPALAGEADAAADAGSATLQEIIVTAQKRSESLQQVPVAVTAFTSADLKNLGVEHARDLNAPNFIFPQIYTTSRSYISMRGVFQEANTILFDSGFSAYLDGVYLGKNISYDADVGDVDHIEILRGPQGTLFGKNTIAGLMNTVTRDPEGRFTGNLIGEAGSLDLVRVRGSLNVPLADDKLAARISVQSVRRDGYVDNTTHGGPREGGLDVQSGRFKIRYAPDDDLKITAALDYLRSSNLGYASEAVASESTGPVLGDDRRYTTQSDVQPVEYKRDFGGSLDVERQFGGYALTSLTGARETRTRFVLDDDASAKDMLSEDSRDEQTLWSEELRLASPTGGRFDWVAGLYYYDELARADDRVRLGPDYTLSPNFSVFYNFRVKTRDAAAFVHANFKVTDKLKLFGGLRYTDEVKRLVGDRLVRPLPFTPPAGFVVDPLAPQFVSKISEDNVSWAAGVEYRFNRDAMAYAKASTGFKSGGWNTRDGQPVKPEYLTAYEIGAKTTWLDQRLRVNVAGFWSDYKDLQVRSLDISSLTVVLHNAATVRAKGFEVEVEAAPVENLTLNLGVGYVDSRYTSFRNTFDVFGRPGDFTGHHLPMTPPWTVNGAVQYEQPLAHGAALVWHADVNYLDARYAVLDAGQNGPGYRLPANTVLNARLGYKARDDAWSLFVWAKNLTDVDAPVDRRPTPLLPGLTEQFATYLQPRTYGVSLTAGF